MRENKNTEQDILWICHVPECHVTHFTWRKACVCCQAQRDPPREPNDPDKHLAKAFSPKGAGAQLLELKAGPAAKAKAATQPAKKQEGGNGPNVDGTDCPDEPTLPDTADEFMVDEEEEERKADLADSYFPACLDAKIVRIPVEEDMPIVSLYRDRFRESRR